MRRMAFLLLLACFTLPAFAAKQMNTAELEKLLVSAHSKPDAKLAQQIDDLELTERISSARLARLEPNMPGPQSLQALIAVADASAFRDLPPAELPLTPVPDRAAQFQILSRAFEYVNSVLPLLPNFFATRDTIRFEETPLDMMAGQSEDLMSEKTLSSQPLHMVGSSSVKVYFRDGHELADAPKPTKTAQPTTQELVTPGLFGPILRVVLVDARKGKITWSHWEQGPAGAMAVFRYAVPREVSHYAVAYPSRDTVVQQTAAYHGEIAVDPKTGTILRLTEVAEFEANYPILQSNILVEYGSVEIGGKNYTCPVKSAALFMWRTPSKPGSFSTKPLEIKLNDIRFTQYHVLRSEARILTDDSDQPDATPPPPAAQTNAAPSQPAPVATAPVALVPQPVTPAPAPEAPPLPVDTAAKTESPAVVLHLESNLVLVDAVVTDKGNAVHGLERSRFHISEDNREQAISAFEEHLPSTAPPAATPAPLPPNTYTNTPTYPKATTLYVLLLDQLNTPLEFQESLRQRMREYIGKLPPGTSLAVFALGSQLKLIQGFTKDADLLTKAVTGSLATSRPAIESDHHFVDTIATSSGAAESNGDALAASSIAWMAESVTADQNANRADRTAEAALQLARYLVAIPGRKNLIWFSGSFPAGADSTAALSAARVAVYPVDVRGLRHSQTYRADITNLTVSDSAKAQARENQSEQEVSADQTAMEQIAEATGGQYFNTVGPQDAIASAVEGGASYYTIGYVPATRPDGNFRSIALHLDNANYNLAYRRGYYPDSRVAAANLAPVAAAQFGAPPATQILFEAQLLNISDPQLAGVKLPDGPAGDGAAALKAPVRRVVVQLTLDPHSLVFADGPNGAHQTQLEFKLLAYDANGKRINSVDHAIQLKLTPEQFARVQAADPAHALPRHRLVVDLPSTPVTLRVAVYDPATTHTGSMEIPVPVAAH